jgi:cytochrome oxidase Cu insertion factor (SCO1/SenC/PrrC family)
MKLFKSFNSKGFLLLYLVVFTSLIIVWLYKTEQKQVDNREIPPSLAPLLRSPPMQLPQFLLYSDTRQVLTDQSLRGKWTYVYFTHPACLPQCEAVLSVMHNLQQLAAASEMQFVLINFDNGQETVRPSWWLENRPSLPLYGGDKAVINALTEAFGFLYLRTPLEQGYSLEQQHSIFLVDPKGRVYARFEPPFSSPLIQQQFLALRDFYARSE